MKVILLLMVFCMFACSCPRLLKKDKLSTMDLLTQNSWYLTKGTSEYNICKVIYKKRTVTLLLWFKNTSPKKYVGSDAKFEGSGSYYLSDSIEKTFKPSRVGQNQFGKYIIKKSGSVEEILKLNCDTLITIAVYPDTAIYIGRGPLLYISKQSEK